MGFINLTHEHAAEAECYDILACRQIRVPAHSSYPEQPFNSNMWMFRSSMLPGGRHGGLRIWVLPAHPAGAVQAHAAGAGGRSGRLREPCDERVPVRSAHAQGDVREDLSTAPAKRAAQ